MRFAILMGICWSWSRHVSGWFIMGASTSERLVQGQGIIVAGLVTWFVLLFALATAFAISVVALFERGDLDHLLS